MNIYVGNLSYDTTDRDLETAFARFGQVSSARVATDRETGRSRGFGFVEMPTQSEAMQAMQSMNGTELQGRMLNVNESRPREEGSSRGSQSGSRRSW